MKESMMLYEQTTRGDIMARRLVYGMLTLALVLMLVAAACAPTPSSTPMTTPTLTYPRTIADDLGRNVTIPEKPARIISLYPSFTETLFALGLGEKVVGVTTFCDYPPEALHKEKVGGVTTVDLEKIVALNPDLVLVDARLQREVVQGLGKLGLTVVALYPENFEEILENIRLMGEITGQEQEASRLTADMGKRVKFITDRTKELADSERPKVFYLTWYDPLKSIGPGTLINELIKLAGGKNIAADAKERVPAYSFEMMIARNPQVIILAGGSMTSITVDELKALERWQVVDAVKNGRVYSIDAALIAGPRPRIVDGLEIMAKYIHPALFEDAYEH